MPNQICNCKLDNFPAVPPPADLDPAPPAGALALLDRATGAARAAAHACHSPLAREHLEYALALLAESWIAEDGQSARTPARLIADVRGTLDLFAALAGGEPVSKPHDPRAARLHQQPITSSQ